MSINTCSCVLVGWRTERDIRAQLAVADIDYLPFDPMIAGVPVFVGTAVAEFDKYSDSVIVPLNDLSAVPMPPKPAVGDDWTPGVWFIGHFS